MTMIAIALRGDHAEILTDSLAYNRTARSLGYSTKVQPLLHLDAAVMVQGDHRCAATVETALAAAPLDRDATFANLLEIAPGVLQHAYAELGGHQVVGDVAVFLVGPVEGRYAGYRFTSDEDFTARKLMPMTCYPTPWQFRPSKWELTATRRFFAADDVQAPPDIDAALDIWASKDPLPAPQTAAQWAELADMIAEQRGSEPLAHVLVGGRVHLTRIGDGVASSVVIHEYTAEQMTAILASTFDTAAQAGPCRCGSGYRSRDCCVELIAHEPCPCRSGAALVDCCAIAVDVDAAHRAAAARDGALTSA